MFIFLTDLNVGSTSYSIEHIYVCLPRTKIFFLNFYYGYLFTCVGVMHTCHCACVTVRIQLLWVSSLLPPWVVLGTKLRISCLLASTFTYRSILLKSHSYHHSAIAKMRMFNICTVPLSDLIF